MVLRVTSNDYTNRYSSFKEENTKLITLSLISKLF